MREDIKVNERAKKLSSQLVDKLERIYDPEIELDIYNLGLIYEIEVDENKHCRLLMTFTDIACDCADTIPAEIVEALTQIEGIDTAHVDITFSPVWKMTRISRFGRIALGISPR